MAEREEMVRTLDHLLRAEHFKDYCPNGLQVFGQADITRLATCPSVSEEFLLGARNSGAQGLLVHHGLFWEKTSRVIDPFMGRRLQILLNAQMNLLAYHLPMDAHPELGNNAQLAKVAGLEEANFQFGQYHQMFIGVVGSLTKPCAPSDLAHRFSTMVGGTPLLFDYGKTTCQRVGIVSGGAGDVSFLCEAKLSGCDTYVTGAIAEPAVAMAKESKLNLIGLGHYNSEKLGVRAVGKYLGERFEIEVVHMEYPNPV